MKQIIRWIVAIAVIVALAVWRYQAITQEPSSGKPVIKIGAILPLTGNLATQVPAILDAAQLALKDAIPADSKYEYRLIAEDYAGVPMRAVMAYNKLKNLDKIDVVLPVFALAASPLSVKIKEDKMIMITVTWADEWMAANPYVFNFYAPVPALAAKYAEVAHRKGIKRVGILSQNVPAALYIDSLVQDELRERGIEVVYLEKFNTDNRDFRIAIAKIASKPVDVVLPVFFEPGLSILFKQMKEQRFKTPLAAMDILQASPSAKDFEGFWIVSGENLSPQFEEYFKEKTKKNTHLYSGTTYDAVRVLVQAIENAAVPAGASKPGTDEIRAALVRVKDFDGVIGRFSVNETGLLDIQPKYAVMKNGKAIITEEE